MIEIVRRHVVPAAYSVLPDGMRSDEATAMLVAIAWQESKCRHRKQIVITKDGRKVDGPARGLWQGEKTGGCVRVVWHGATRGYALDALELLCYSRLVTRSDVYKAMEHNDILACVLARLLLWTLPERLPSRDESEMGWSQYMEAWRPGDPRKDEWSESWRMGWKSVEV